jgi:hypothetical protein
MHISWHHHIGRASSCRANGELLPRAHDLQQQAWQLWYVRLARLVSDDTMDTDAPDQSAAAVEKDMPASAAPTAQDAGTLSSQPAPSATTSPPHRPAQPEAAADEAGSSSAQPSATHGNGAPDVQLAAYDAKELLLGLPGDDVIDFEPINEAKASKLLDDCQLLVQFQCVLASRHHFQCASDA